MISPYLSRPLPASSSPRLPPWQAAPALHALPHNCTEQKFAQNFDFEEPDMHPGVVLRSLTDNFGRQIILEDVNMKKCIMSSVRPLCTSEVQSVD